MHGGKEALIELFCVILVFPMNHSAVKDWHFDILYGSTLHGMVHQPMLELLNYLRANDFKTYIVSGGGIEFMRVFSEVVYSAGAGNRIQRSYGI